MTVKKPWGYYENSYEKEGIKLKKIVINPDQMISLQQHFFRAEYWIILKGTAKVINDNRVYILNPKDSCFIPRKTWHRVKNIGDVDLVIYEAQWGECCTEDDIERKEDMYGRA